MGGVGGVGVGGVGDAARGLAGSGPQWTIWSNDALALPGHAGHGWPSGRPRPRNTAHEWLWLALDGLLAGHGHSPANSFILLCQFVQLPISIGFLNAFQSKSMVLGIWPHAKRLPQNHYFLNIAWRLFCQYQFLECFPIKIKIPGAQLILGR